MNRSIKVLKKYYNLAKGAKTKTTIICPSCGCEIIKTTYHKTFCSLVCKDYYWNNVTPNKRCNTTRISPRSKAWLERMREEREDYKFYED